MRSRRGWRRLGLVLTVAALVAGSAVWLLSSRIHACWLARRFAVERAELVLVAAENLFWHEGAAGELTPPRRIAHGGGIVDGVTVSNSLEALERSYARGFRWFEVDLSWTADGHPVLIHDWGPSLRRLFSAPQEQLSLSEFRSLRMTHGLTQLTLDDAMRWLAAHPDAFIVTDVKEHNLATLEAIATGYPKLRRRIVPQIYRFREERPVRNLGFDHVIITLYVKNYSNFAITHFLASRRVLAVTMPVARADSGLAARLNALGFFVYAHTVNSEAECTRLKRAGVGGVYTDSLPP